MTRLGVDIRFFLYKELYEVDQVVTISNGTVKGNQVEYFHW